MSSSTTAPAPSLASAAAVPWVERYRPRELGDVSHQVEVVQALKNAVETDRLPHLLFYGKPGTGKTSVALALCRELWHPSQVRSRVLELNASDERGISVVRDKIKHFASLAVGTSGPGSGQGVIGGGRTGTVVKKKKRSENDGGKGEEGTKEEKTYPNPPYKIIILDEADTVTPDAQSALRRIIEAHSRITRFILICNYVTRIIEPLASRCAKFRFQALPPPAMRARLEHVADSEGCRFGDGDDDGGRDRALDKILELSDGDMRRAITTLQSAHSLTGRGRHGPIKAEGIAEMAGIPPKHIIDNLLTSLKSNSFAQMEKAVTDTVAEGYSVQTILSMLAESIVSDTKLSDIGKADVCIRIAEADKNLVDGADGVLQLMSVCSLAVRCMAAASPVEAQ